MIKRPPSIMISSTFYDLRQIRADLASFVVDQLAYVPLLSELNSFPVDPDADTVENCRRRVENDADMLILLVGGRYGSVDKRSLRSVTNLEYAVARVKGIPVFAFVEKRILALLPVWKSNPSADFSPSVDDARVFQFIEEVRSADSVWTFEFETAKEIIETLRAQFAYLMTEGLHFKLRSRSSSSFSLDSLAGESLKVAIDRPRLWEHRLLADALRNQLLASRDLRKEHQIGLTLGVSEYVCADQFSSWASARLHELEGVVGSLGTLVNETLQIALGQPGEPGDVDAIVFVAKKLGQAYTQAIDWSLRVRRTCIDEAFDPVKVEMARFTDNIIGSIEEFSAELLKRNDEALDAIERGDKLTIRIDLSLTVSNFAEFHSALERSISQIQHDRGLSETA